MREMKFAVGPSSFLILTCDGFLECHLPNMESQIANVRKEEVWNHPDKAAVKLMNRSWHSMDNLSIVIVRFDGTSTMNTRFHQQVLPDKDYVPNGLNVTANLRFLIRCGYTIEQALDSLSHTEREILHDFCVKYKITSYPWSHPS